MKTAHALSTACFFTLGAAALGMAFLGGGSFDLDWNTIDGGGGVSAGGNLELHGTIGQWDAAPPLTGGTFELAGGYWPGGGPSTSPAVLTDFATVFGTLQSGGLTNLLTSNDDHIIMNSVFGFSAQESNIVQIKVGAMTAATGASLIHLKVESRLNNPGGTAKVFVHNWATGQAQQVHEYAIGQVEMIETIDDIDATDRIRQSDGRIEVQLKASVIATFSASGFEALYDWLDVTVE